VFQKLKHFKSVLSLQTILDTWIYLS